MSVAKEGGRRRRKREGGVVVSLPAGRGHFSRGTHARDPQCVIKDVSKREIGRERHTGEEDRGKAIMWFPVAPLAASPLPMLLLLQLLLSPAARASSISAHEEEAATEQRPKMFVDYLNGPLKGKTARTRTERK